MRYVLPASALLFVLVALPLRAADDKKGDAKKDAPAPAKTDKKADAKQDKKDAAKKGEPAKTDKKPDAKANPKAGPGLPGMPNPGGKKPVLPPNTNTEKSVRAGVVTGRITAVIEDKKSVRLQVTMYVPQINAGELQNIANAQMNMARATNPQDLINAQQQLIQAQARLVTYQTVQKEYELEATEDIKVRLANPPPQFDEKGRIKKYTQAELKELKGPDPKLRGYKGEFSDLRQEQIVEVHLMHKKEPPRRPGRPMAKEAVDLLTENLPQMSMIMVLYEPKQ
jgi:hypothetical protein